MNKNDKVYPQLGNIYSNEFSISSFANSSPFKDINVAFHWVNFSYPRYHGHSDWEITVALSGKILHKINGKTESLYSNDACLIGPRHKHAFVIPKGESFQGITIIAKDAFVRLLSNTFFGGLYNELINRTTPLHITLSDNVLESISNCLLTIQAPTQQNKESYEKSCTIIFNFLFSYFIKQNFLGLDGLSQELMDFVRILNNPYLKESEIYRAKQAIPYSYSQLTRIFRNNFGCTITHYINHVKMQHATELLESSELSISDISNELNFESTNYFYRLFKKTYNITPLQYRKRLLSVKNTYSHYKKT